MNREWWEGPVCVVCDYWWIILIVIVVGLGVYLTRDYWMQWIGLL